VLAKINVVLLALGLSTAIDTPPVMASTSVYTFGGLLSGTLQSCLANAKAAGVKAGFTAFQQEVFDANQKAGDFHASKPGTPLSMTMRCDPVLGVFSIGVSGIDSKQTFESLRAIVRSL